MKVRAADWVRLQMQLTRDKWTVWDAAMVVLSLFAGIGLSALWIR